MITLLQTKGFHVVDVQNPLTSLTDDVAATVRMIALQDGPVILVGHSYAGVAITETGNDPKVVGLVYKMERGRSSRCQDRLRPGDIEGIAFGRVQKYALKCSPTRSSLVQD